MDLQENHTLPHWLSLCQFNDGSVNDYFDNEAGLIDNLVELTARCSSLISNKDEADFDEVDTWISSFIHHLMAHTIQVGLLYPLSKSYQAAKDVQPNTDEKIIQSFITMLDRDAKFCFTAICGFQIEIILKKIAQKHKIKWKKFMRDRFNDVLTHFTVPNEDKLNLIDIFYWTRNTLHNGGFVDRSGERSYKSHTFVFEKDKEIKHATWDYLIYFVREIIGLFEEILHSEKYGNCHTSVRQ